MARRPIMSPNWIKLQNSQPTRIRMVVTSSGGAERPYMELIIVTPSPKINFATSYSVQGEGGGRSDHIWKKYLPRGQFGRGGLTFYGNDIYYVIWGQWDGGRGGGGPYMEMRRSTSSGTTFSFFNWSKIIFKKFDKRIVGDTVSILKAPREFR